MENSFAVSKSELLTPAKSEPLQQDAGLLSREAHVLTRGLSEGLLQGASKSANDLQEFGASLAKDPAGTLSTFAQKHWSEAAVAATLSFVAPRKWANSLIALASTRGVATATYDSMMLAADSKNNITDVKNFYANSIAHETNTLINSLPATIAGGMAGKMGANAVFGKNMGAWDLATGEVKLKDVKSNLWDLHDKVFPPTAKLVVSDLDGTLVAANKHLGLGINKAIDRIAETTNTPRQEVSDLLHEQFDKLHSYANKWTVELAFADKFKVGQPGGMSLPEFRTKVSDVYWNTLKETAPQYLDLYPDVKNTIAELSKRNIDVVIFSNSPASAVLPRMELHGLDAQAARIMALKNGAAPKGMSPELLAEGSKRLAEYKASPNVGKVVELDHSIRKPNPQALQDLMAERNLRPKEVIMVGDSIRDDMGIAQNAGARGLRAKYSEMDAKYDALIGHKNPVIPKDKMPKFEAEINSYAELLDRLKPARDLSAAFAQVRGLPAWYVPVQSYGLLGTNEKKAGN
jgi:HAD superfamily hydrolase (TIGR01662 family)